MHGPLNVRCIIYLSTCRNYRKYLEGFEIRRCRRTEKISWSDRVKNEEVLKRVKENRNVLHIIKRKKAKWIGRILRRNCLQKHVIE
jgi:hypothetical protein